MLFRPKHVFHMLFMWDSTQCGATASNTSLCKACDRTNIQRADRKVSLGVFHISVTHSVRSAAMLTTKQNTKRLYFYMHSIHSAESRSPVWNICYFVRVRIFINKWEIFWLNSLSDSDFCGVCFYFQIYFSPFVLGLCKSANLLSTCGINENTVKFMNYQPYVEIRLTNYAFDRI